MNTKGWSLFILAPVAISMSLLTTACGKDEKKKASSPYEGLWMGQSAFDAYVGAKGNEFCDSVYHRPDDHGIIERQTNEKFTRVGYKAVRISSAGQIYHWTPALRWGTPEAAPYQFGTLGDGGLFAPPPPQDPRASFSRSAFESNPYLRVYPVEGRLDMYRKDGYTETYVRVTEVELMEYSRRVMKCGNNQFQAIEYGYGYSDRYGAVGPNGFYEEEGFDPYPQQGPQYQGPRRPQLNQQVPEDTGPVK